MKRFFRQYGRLTLALAAVLAFCAVLPLLFQQSRSIETGSWGLSFRTEGQPPAGNASKDALRRYDAVYLGDESQKKIYLTFDAGYENGCTEPILEALGAPFGYGEYRSGAYAGVEKTYRFQGLNLRTYPSQDGERILGVMITDSSLQTPEGISIGDSASRVRECFGSDAIQSGCCTVSRSGEQMVVLLEHNVVTAIQYSLI